MSTCVPNLRGQGGCYCGRRGLPREWVQQMFAEYQSGLSLEQVGRNHGRTRQGIFGIFQTAGLPLRAKQFLPVVRRFGFKFTAQKTAGRHRYLRATVRKDKTMYLHHLVWEKHRGPIPPGFKVCFKNGNHRDVRISNLELLSNSDQVRKYASKGENESTKTAAARLALLIAGRGKQFARLAA
jgi:hypothetical protein